jgi:hypothetical protein
MFSIIFIFLVFPYFVFAQNITLQFGRRFGFIGKHIVYNVVCNKKCSLFKNGNAQNVVVPKDIIDEIVKESFSRENIKEPNAAYIVKASRNDKKRIFSFALPSAHLKELKLFLDYEKKVLSFNVNNGKKK